MSSIVPLMFFVATLFPIQDPTQGQALPLVLRSRVSFSLKVPRFFFVISDTGIFEDCGQVVLKNVLWFGVI